MFRQFKVQIRIPHDFYNDMFAILKLMYKSVSFFKIMCFFHDFETSRIGRLQTFPDGPRCFPVGLRTHKHDFRSNLRCRLGTMIWGSAEAIGFRCDPLWKPVETNEKSMKIHEKSMEINGNSLIGIP